MGTKTNEPTTIPIPSRLVCALNLDNCMELWDRHSIEIVEYKKCGRGQSAMVLCPTREAVVALIAELMYRWEEREGWDPDLRAESNYCGEVGTRLAVKHQIDDDEWPRYIWGEVKHRVRKARQRAENR
jgi:hypothetical protein